MLDALHVISEEMMEDTMLPENIGYILQFYIHLLSCPLPHLPLYGGGGSGVLPGKFLIFYIAV
jgi:hypothetical protein